LETLQTKSPAKHCFAGLLLEYYYILLLHHQFAFGAIAFGIGYGIEIYAFV